MLKKLVFSLILAVFILGVGLLLPKSTKEPPFVIKLPTLNLNKNWGKPETSIILVGDIMLGRSVMKESLSKNDPTYPFKNIAETLRQADLVFGNLETPIIENCTITTTGMVFCTDPKMIEGLKFAGIDIVNLANNHTMNYGNEGFIQTQNFLKENGIDYVGVGNLIVKEFQGTKFGFLGFNFVDRWPTNSDYQFIQDSKSKVDVLITMVHWGNEYTPDPNLSQKEIAAALIKNGSDIVSGGHSHWTQGIDTINGKPIFYSLGNFVFDQAWSDETKKGLAIKLTYEGKILSKIEEMPVYMENFAQPKFVQQ